MLYKYLIIWLFVLILYWDSYLGFKTDTKIAYENVYNYIKSCYFKITSVKLFNPGLKKGIKLVLSALCKAKRFPFIIIINRFKQGG